MPSPFPGMDPWLEDEEVFPDLHNRLLTHLSEAINLALPKGYIATMANRVWVDDDTRREPDASVFGPDRDTGAPWTGNAAFEEAGLMLVATEAAPEPWEEPYLEIRSAQGRRLVTAVEVLSRANKSPGKKGRGAYLQKQGEFRLSDTNLVEIDLLRGGPHTTAVAETRLKAVAGAYDYHLSVMLTGVRDRIFVSPIRLGSRLPAVPVPLDPDVKPVFVELQPLIDHCYDAGKYAELVQYSRPCVPPLTAEQQAWAEGLLRTKGLLP